MKAYRALIKPQICYPDQHYNAVCRDLEEDGKWYLEEEKEAIKKKYKHLENTFEQVVFDVKYEPIDAIPVEWMRDKMRGYASSLKSTETAALVMVMQMWQKEQEAR